MEKFVTRICLSLMFLLTTNIVLGQSISLDGDPNSFVSTTSIPNFEIMYEAAGAVDIYIEVKANDGAGMPTGPSLGGVVALNQPATTGVSTIVRTLTFGTAIPPGNYLFTGAYFDAGGFVNKVAAPDVPFTVTAAPVRELILDSDTTTFVSASSFPDFDIAYQSDVAVDIYVEIKADDGMGNPTGAALGGVTLRNQAATTGSPVVINSTVRVFGAVPVPPLPPGDYLFTGAYFDAGGFTNQISAANIPFTVTPPPVRELILDSDTTTFVSATSFPDFDVSYQSDVAVDIFVEIKADDGMGNPTGSALGGVTLSNQPATTGSVTVVNTSVGVFGMAPIPPLPPGNYFFTGASFGTGGGPRIADATNVPFIVTAAPVSQLVLDGDPTSFVTTASIPNFEIMYEADRAVDITVAVFANDGMGAPTGASLGGVVVTNQPATTGLSTITSTLTFASALPPGDYLFTGSFVDTGSTANQVDAANVPFTVTAAPVSQLVLDGDPASFVTTASIPNFDIMYEADRAVDITVAVFANDGMGSPTGASLGGVVVTNQPATTGLSTITSTLTFASALPPGDYLFTGSFVDTGSTANQVDATNVPFTVTAAPVSQLVLDGDPTSFVTTASIPNFEIMYEADRAVDITVAVFANDGMGAPTGASLGGVVVTNQPATTGLSTITSTLTFASALPPGDYLFTGSFVDTGSTANQVDATNVAFTVTATPAPVANITIIASAEAIPITTVSASATGDRTFNVPFTYTSDEAIGTLTVELEFVAFGPSGPSTFPIPGSAATFTNLPAATDAPLMATITFPSDNPITDADTGNIWTISATGGTATESDLSVVGAGPNTGYRVKFTTDNDLNTITGTPTSGGGGDFPLNASGPISNVEFRDLDILEITDVAAPPVTDVIRIESITNAATNGVAAIPIASVTRGQTFPVEFTYTSSVDIAELTVNLEVVGFNGAFREFPLPGTEAVLTNLVAGDNLTATAMLTFPATAEVTAGNGDIWTLDPSQVNDDGNPRDNDPIALRNNVGSTLTNYRIQFTIGAGQTFSNPNNAGGIRLDTFISTVNDAPSGGNQIILDGDPNSFESTTSIPNFDISYEAAGAVDIYVEVKANDGTGMPTGASLGGVVVLNQPATTGLSTITSTLTFATALPPGDYLFTGAYFDAGGFANKVSAADVPFTVTAATSGQIVLDGDPSTFISTTSISDFEISYEAAGAVDIYVEVKADDGSGIPTGASLGGVVVLNQPATTGLSTITSTLTFATALPPGNYFFTGAYFDAGGFANKVSATDVPFTVTAGPVNQLVLDSSPTSFVSTASIPNFDISYEAEGAVDIYIEVKADDGTGMPTGASLGGVVVLNQPATTGLSTITSTLSFATPLPPGNYLFTGAYFDAGGFENRIDAMDVSFTVSAAPASRISLEGNRTSFTSTTSISNFRLAYQSPRAVDIYVEVRANDGTGMPTGDALGGVTLLNQAATGLSAISLTLSFADPLLPGDYLFIANYFDAGTFDNRVDAVSVPFTVIRTGIISDDPALFSPNPAKDIIRINNEMEVATYQVVSTSGILIMEGRAEETIDISDLATGIYFLVTDKGTAKFVKI
ncbi:T9SS C-terminal target domain-containing protein [Aquimarina sp. AD10]|uniref:T9SS type A sorting domain-containing protein n=1 Tax=Aquimarina sp. AD10 TaxID=1714849 RepID=UPI000E467739|nr:T9SS type A sorting domain-containing protein [Aquimarina sp. AD10]AXT60520.1 T9SS C-terminal target domain-containing protein [Aquimarina sp. AD10]